MPKIGSINLLYDGDHHIKHEIFYSQDNKFHIKGLNDEFCGITGFKTYGYETERELDDKVKDACRKYRVLKTNSKLVILYKCVASAELRMNKVSDGNYQGLSNGVSGKIQNIQYNNILSSFGIDYQLAQIVDDGVQKKYFKVNKETKEVQKYEINLIGSGFQTMDYTEEREQFFLGLIDMMKKMVVSASKFFGADSEAAALFIEQKQNLLN